MLTVKIWVCVPIEHSQNLIRITNLNTMVAAKKYHITCYYFANVMWRYYYEIQNI